MVYPYQETFTPSLATSDGNYPSNSGLPMGGESGYISVSGTFGGATAVLQLLDRNNTWVPIDNGTWTSPLVKDFHIPQGSNIRLNISGSGGSTSIYCNMEYFKFRPGSA